MPTCDFGRSLAVVIGIDRYRNGIPALQTAGSDARAVAALLREKHGYEPHLLIDDEATLAGLTALLEVELPARVADDDRVFFYFAGHGVALNGDDGPQGFILPQDARRDAADSFLAMPDLHAALCALRCRHLLAVLDCCFAGAFRWSSTRDVVPLPSVLHRERYDRFIKDPAWQVISSAAHDEQAMDVLLGRALGSRGGASEHSPFAELLLDGLAGAGDVVPAGGGDGVITATELYVYLDDALARRTADRDRRQTPCLWPLKKHDKGQYIFLAPGHPLNLPPAPTLTGANNPYRGLESFGEEHKALFFGRDRVIQSLLAHVNKQGLTVVVGASGTGKSSLVKAGLVPALREQGWEVLPIVRPGMSPLKSIAAALLRPNVPGSRLSGQVPPVTGELPVLSSQLTHWFTDQPDGHYLLVVDQMEELVTMCRDEAERWKFVGSLVEALQAYPDRLKVVLTIRSDFEPQVARGPVESLWQTARFVVPPMTQDELRDAIEKPASERVVYFDPPALVDELINEVVQTPGALPLLSFTLSELYVRYLDRRADDRALARIDYAALGGVIGALRHRATEEYDRLDPASQATMRRVMLRMVSLEGGDVARRRVPMSELVYLDETENQRVRHVIEGLTQARLVVRGSESEGDPYVEPAHDELVRGWDKLWDWIREERQHEDGLAFQRRVTQAAHEWAASKEEGAGMGLLWQDPARTALLERALKSRSPWPNAVEVRFGRQSIKRRLRNRYARFLAVAAIALTAVVASYEAVAATRNQKRAESAESTARLRADEATSARDTAEQRRKEALASRDTAEEQRRRAEEETRTALSRELGGRVDRLLREGHYDLALLVAVKANDIKQTYEARNALLTALQQSPAALLYPDDPDADPPSALAVNPGGSAIVAAYGDSLVVWGAEGSKWSKRPLEGFHGGARTMTFSPDGRLLALGNASVVLYDVSRHRTLSKRLEQDAGPVSLLAFSSDGRTLTGAGPDGKVLRWDMETARLRGPPLVAPAGSILNIHGDTLTTLTTQGHKRIATLWNLVTRQQISTHEVTRAGTLLALSPDGATVALKDTNGMVVLWDFLKDEEVGRPLAPAPKELAFDVETAVARGETRKLSAMFSPDGQVLALAVNSGFLPTRGTVVLWDVRRGEQIGQVLQGSLGGVKAMAFSQDGQLLATSSDPLMLWNVGSRQQVTRVLEEPGLGGPSVAFSPDDRTLATGRDSGRVALWNVESGKQQREFETGIGARFIGLQYGRNGRSLTVGDVDGIIGVWDIEAGRRLGDLLQVGDDIYRLLFSPDGRLLVVSGSSYIRVWDLVKRKRLLRLAGRGEGIGVPAAFSRDGHMIAWGATGATLADEDEQDEVGLWQFDAQQHRAGIPLAGWFGLVGVSLSPDRRTVAWMGRMGSRIMLADITSGRVLDSMGTRGSLHASLQGNRLAFSPDGRTLASSSASGEDDESARNDQITLWDVETERQLGEPIPAGVYTVTDLVWSHDGRRLASGGFYLGNSNQVPGGVSLSDASVESWRTLACRAANRNLTRAEWKLAMPGVEYQILCQGLPTTDYAPRPVRDQ